MQLRRSTASVFLLAALVSLCSEPASAPERGAIARRADVVVVGRLEGAKATRHRDAWLIQGRIAVDEVVFGPVKRDQRLDYEFVCYDCPKSRPGLKVLSTKKGLWFLIHSTSGVWESAALSPSTDLGVRGLDELEYFRGVLRLREGSKPRKESP